tara:strand:+ start:2361 stop:3095 length:735 start_codon:yes stop_codon:yes gene_type:complete
MSNDEIIARLKNDEDYYGEFGKQYLSNSKIDSLLNNPLSFNDESEKTSAFLVGGYLHTAILEPNKLKKYKIIDSSTRNTNAYKEMSGGELCLLQHEVDKIDLMQERIMSNDVCNQLIRVGNVDYEVPNIAKIGSNVWKGKADVINHDDGMIIDIKTTSNISAFRSSAYRYNYDSQAYIYSELFPGYSFTFLVIDKSTLQLGIYDCSDTFLQSGMDKVERANLNYDLFFKLGDNDPSQFLTTETL